jgi:hypothetical protein
VIINKPVIRVSNILLALFLASTAFAGPVMAQRNYCEIVKGLDGLGCYDLASYQKPTPSIMAYAAARRAQYAPPLVPAPWNRSARSQSADSSPWRRGCVAAQYTGRSTWSPPLPPSR